VVANDRITYSPPEQFNSGWDQLLEPVPLAAPAVSAETVRALDELAMHLREPIVVYGLADGRSTELLDHDGWEPSDIIAGVRMTGTPIVCSPDDTARWSAFPQRFPVVDLLIDEPDSHSAETKARDVFARYPRRFATVHVRTRDGVRSFAAS
jgi:hypothetical protein